MVCTLFGRARSARDRLPGGHPTGLISPARASHQRHTSPGCGQTGPPAKSPRCPGHATNGVVPGAPDAVVTAGWPAHFLARRYLIGPGRHQSGRQSQATTSSVGGLGAGRRHSRCPRSYLLALATPSGQRSGASTSLDRLEDRFPSFVPYRTGTWRTCPIGQSDCRSCYKPLSVGTPGRNRSCRRR
jgi:hypothetical protein